MRFFDNLYRMFRLLHRDLRSISRSIDNASLRSRSRIEELQRPEEDPPERQHIGVNDNVHRASCEETRDRIRLRIEAATLSVGVLVAAVNLLLWVQTRQATRIAAQSAAVAETGAKTSVIQAQTARASVDATVSQFRLEQRAWVGISPIDLTNAAKGSPFHGIGVYAENAGKTPSNRTYAIVGFYIHRGTDSFVPNSEDETFMRKMINEFRSGKLTQADLIPSKGLRARTGGPNGPLGPSPALPSRVFIGAMTPNIQYPIRYDEQVAVAGARGILYGTVFYDDVDKQTHTTSFCYYCPEFERFERLVACPVFNEMN